MKAVRNQRPLGRFGACLGGKIEQVQRSLKGRGFRRFRKQPACKLGKRQSQLAVLKDLVEPVHHLDVGETVVQ